MFWADLPAQNQGNSSGVGWRVARSPSQMVRGLKARFVSRHVFLVHMSGGSGAPLRAFAGVHRWCLGGESQTGLALLVKDGNRKKKGKKVQENIEGWTTE